MYAEEGFNGYYKGLGMILAKQLPYTVTQLTVFSLLNDLFYDKLEKHSKKSKLDLSTFQQLTVSVCCGIVAGVASAIASHPPDTVLSRINMAAKKQIHAGVVEVKQNSSNWDATKQIVSELGFKGLWKGLGTRCFMVGALSAGMFLIYDSVKVLCGLPTSSGVGKKQH